VEYALIVVPLCQAQLLIYFLFRPLFRTWPLAISPLTRTGMEVGKLQSVLDQDLVVLLKPSRLYEPSCFLPFSVAICVSLRGIAGSAIIALPAKRRGETAKA
jgi:hypothetical protein